MQRRRPACRASLGRRDREQVASPVNFGQSVNAPAKRHLLAFEIVHIIERIARQQFMKLRRLRTALIQRIRIVFEHESRPIKPREHVLRPAQHGDFIPFNVDLKKVWKDTR